MTGAERTPTAGVLPRNGRNGSAEILEGNMLWTIAAILVVLWLLGFFAFHIAGGLIHILLVVAVVVVAYQFLTGRRKI
tara:strand:+ start:262 stop:495 length:234 start_codon:yes stop_codon:yes gene_type:complete